MECINTNAIKTYFVLQSNQFLQNIQVEDQEICQSILLDLVEVVNFINRPHHINFVFLNQGERFEKKINWVFRQVQEVQQVDVNRVVERCKVGRKRLVPKDINKILNDHSTSVRKQEETALARKQQKLLEEVENWNENPEERIESKQNFAVPFSDPSQWKEVQESFFDESKFKFVELSP